MLDRHFSESFCKVILNALKVHLREPSGWVTEFEGNACSPNRQKLWLKIPKFDNNRNLNQLSQTTRLIIIYKETLFLFSRLFLVDTSASKRTGNLLVTLTCAVCCFHENRILIVLANCLTNFAFELRVFTSIEPFNLNDGRRSHGFGQNTDLYFCGLSHRISGRQVPPLLV